MKKLKIHFVGIKGVGMTPLAIIAQEAGHIVTGCDTPDTYITDSALRKAQIMPMIGFSPEHIKDSDLVITTGAHGGYQNPEVKYAINKKVKVLTQGEALGHFMEGKIFGRDDMQGISIAGCHGKTTTTAMVANILKDANVDPSYAIGTSEIHPLGLPGHYGKGTWFIAEADEYATEPTVDKTAKFLWQRPEIAVFTNIEWDHPDIYPSIHEVSDAFIAFTKKIKKGGILILNKDDAELQKIHTYYKGKIIQFGFTAHNEYQIKEYAVKKGVTSFSLYYNDKKVDTFSLKLSGEHNVMNATAAIIVSLQCSVPVEVIRKSLADFIGTKRRLEFRGLTRYGALVYDDYAHHPTAIRKTLGALLQKHPNKKIISIFQPHTYSRTKLLLDQFITSFGVPYAVLVTKIYASEREKQDLTISSEIFVEKLQKVHKHAVLLQEMSDMVKYIGSQKYDSEYCIIVMGAGDIYKIIEEIIVI